ncbi:MAG: DNA adenine methylase [Candidatus Baldrarchaeia archaeon]
MRFIGSKENLLSFIDKVIKQVGVNGNTICDIFSGTVSVAKNFKRKGYTIISNDNLYFSYLIQKTYIENNTIPQFSGLASWLKHQSTYDSRRSNFQNAVDYLNNMRGIKDYIFNNYAPSGEFERMYLTDQNAQKADAIQLTISDWDKEGLISDIEKTILKTCLVEAVPFVSNISGTYGAFLKSWDKRAFNTLTLLIPELITSNNPHSCFNKDANDLIREIETDILYLDPPYNTRQYISNYHVLETIARNDKIKLKGKTGLRTDESLHKSKYSQKAYCVEAFEDLIENARTNYILMSYNSEGIIPENDIERIFRNKGKNYTKFQKAYRRFKSNSKKITDSCINEYIYFAESPKITYHPMPNLKETSPMVSEESSKQLPLFNVREGDKVGKLGVSYGSRGIYDVRNELNDLTGKEWVYHTNSIEVVQSSQEDLNLYKFIIELLETRYSTKGKEGFSHDLRSKNPSPKPPQLMKSLIEFFTKEGGWILDPFMGVGGTLLGASLINRNAVGIDLSKEYIGIYKRVCMREGLKEQVTVIGDSQLVDTYPEVTGRNFDMILTDPPYSDMMLRNKTGEAAKKKRNTEPTPFTNMSNDIGNKPLPVYLNDLKAIIEKCLKYLKNRGYVLIFTKDIQPTKDYTGMLHADIIKKLVEIQGLEFKGYKIWFDKTVNLYPYGYPFAYVSHQLHQFILIFRKELEAKRNSINI